MKRLISIIMLIVMLLGIIPALIYAQSKNRSKSERENEDKIVVLSQMELLAGIMTQISDYWDESFPITDLNNDYYIELEEFFRPYKNHLAITLAQKLIKEHNFTYDAVPHFAVRLGELPNLNVPNGYGDYLIERTGDKKLLESFRIAMKDLALKSNFKRKFFDYHKEFYDEYINIIRYSLEQPVEKSVHDLLGDKGYKNVIVLGCGFKSGNAFSAMIKDKKGKVTVFSTMTPIINRLSHLQFATGDGTLLMHEYGHAYINPLTEKYQKDIKNLKLNRLYEQEAENLYKSGYSGLNSFINDSMLYGLMAYIKKKMEIYYMSDL